MPSTYRLTKRETQATTLIRVGTALFGNGGFAVIGGPCSIEGAEQIQTSAHAVRSAGGVMLRGGAYKVRTSPYDFQGLGDIGVEMIVEAGHRAGLPVVVEGLSETHVDRLATHVDMIQIGARNMQNFPLIQHAARTGLPILLKGGPSATLDELLLAAEYALLENNPNVVLCERGIRSFDSQTRNVLDLGGALRLKELTHLPVIVDPSHASGRRSLIEPLTYAAAAAGLDGAIIEMHPDPDASLSDAAQAIDCATFARILKRVRALIPDSSERDDVAHIRTGAQMPPLPELVLK
ncbi:MAG TPA: 3-deoxy-7-phosphoheptulonate synthase [Candidatus Baltobacteraceae bacterium]|nr:3-deoxy-7-phosphoheptulonate synthase [Candidatus Baltobacteraceae bacterium]